MSSFPAAEESVDELTSDERRLIHALQVAPRASWAALGAVLDCDPVTVRRRWSRLHERGAAWVTAYRVRPGTIALVELRCAPGRALNVARSLAEDPEAVTIDVTAGDRDVVVTVWCDSEAGLAEYLLHRFAEVPYVVDARTHLVADVIDDARSWRLRELTAAEIALLESPGPAVRSRGTADQGLVDVVVAELARDGRIGATALAKRLGLTADRARTALAAALGTDGVVVRTEVARPLSGRPNYAWFFLRVPSRWREDVLRRLAGLHDLRLLVSTVGGCNVIMALWLEHLDDVQRIEAVIEQRFPDVQVLDRSLVLRTTKHLGRPLSVSGRSLAGHSPAGGSGPDPASAAVLGVTRGGSLA